MDAELAWVDRAESALLHSVSRLTADAFRGPSGLAGWTRGHVVAHVARNADGLTNLLRWADTGVETPMYADPGARAAGIESGAMRAHAESVRDLAESASRWMSAARTATPASWATPVVLWRSDGPVPARGIVAARLVEVEVHHVDLDVGYTFADVPPAAAEVIVGQSVPRLRRTHPTLTVRADDVRRAWRVGAGAPSTVVVAGGVRDLAGWLTGRTSGDGLRLSGAAVLPDLPDWG